MLEALHQLANLTLWMNRRPPPLDPFGPLGNVGRGLVAYDSDSDDGESPRTALVRVCAESNDACCY